MARPRRYDAWGSRVAAAPCATGLPTGLRRWYRRRTHRGGNPAGINVIASLRSGVATLLTLGGYIG